MEKHTLETFADKYGLTKQAALNKLSKLRKQNKVKTQGGGKQKRIYTITNLPKKPTNGFYDIVNKYSPEKLHPKFEHYTYGKYTAENAIIDGLKLNDIRTKEATKYLFRHVNDWQKLFELAKKNNLKNRLIQLYEEARKSTKTKTMPKKYLK